MVPMTWIAFLEACEGAGLPQSEGALPPAHNPEPGRMERVKWTCGVMFAEYDKRP